jgi:hypothetical protein
MPELLPYTTVSSGGLDLSAPPYELLRTPNVALLLNNFEVAVSGGYRRINGFTLYGTTSATRPEGANKILGIEPYALGVVVCVDTSVYYSEDGITWLQINKDTTSGGKTAAQMPATAALDRPNQGRAQMKMMTAPTGRTTTTYGVLNVATGDDNLARFRIEGTGGSRTFHWEEYTTGAPTGATYIENHEKHMCVVDSVNAPSTVYYSNNNDDSDYTGTGSGSIVVPEKIVGIKSFRSALYIFCDTAIYKLVNINDASTIAIETVTARLGCVSGYTIQEIGGDLIFLATDGLRTIAGTERISDVELGTLSHKIQPLLKDILDDSADFTFASTVIRNKNQYRLFYTNESNEYVTQKGLIGTLRPNLETGTMAFEWSTTLGIEVSALASGSDAGGEEVSYHGDLDGYVFTHDSGSTFNGTNIVYTYQTPDIDFGDAGLGKTLHYMLLSIKPEGAQDIKLKVSYDFNSPSLVQPAQQDVGTVSFPSYYGTGVYGTATYGSITPIKRVNLRGSGTSAAFKFSGVDANPPFTITGFYITFVPSDRR